MPILLLAEFLGTFWQAITGAAPPIGVGAHP